MYANEQISLNNHKDSNVQHTTSLNSKGYARYLIQMY